MDGTGGGLLWCGDAAGQWPVRGRAGWRWTGGSMAGLSRRVWWFFLGWQVWWWVAVSRLALVVAYLLCGFALRFVRLAFVVASHAVLTWRAGEGGGLILPALAKSTPPLPSPPRHHGTARCAACGYADSKYRVPFAPRLHRFACVFASLSFFRVTPHSGAGAHGIARARGEPSDNLCSQRAEDGSPLERAQSELMPSHHRAQSEATPLQPCNRRLTPCPGAE